MTTQTEALKLALEALSPWSGENANHTEQYAAYYAIDKALAQPAVAEQHKQEPVARLHITETDDYPDIEVEVLNGASLQPSMSPVNVYTTPPQPKEPEQEPVAWMAERNGKYYAVDETDWGSFPVYTTPPQPKEPEQEPVACEEEHPNSRYLFKRLCGVAGIELGKDNVSQALDKIAKLRQTLLIQPAQPEQEPVASVYEIREGTSFTLVYAEAVHKYNMVSEDAIVQSFYTHPPVPTAQPEQEYKRGYADAMNWKVQNHLEHLQPKVRTGDCLLTSVCASEGHKIAPQRTWESLSIFEINDLVENTEYEDYRGLVEATEAKLRKKNQ